MGRNRTQHRELENARAVDFIFEQRALGEALIVEPSIIAVVAAASVAASPPSAPRNPRVVAAPQYSAASDRSNYTIATDLAGSSFSSVVIQQPAVEKQENSRDYWSPEWGLVWVTLILAAVTFGLAVYTGKLYRATVKLGSDAESSNAKSLAIAKQAADAAEQQVAIQARQTDIQAKQHAIGRLQFIAAHRPRIRFRYIWPHCDIWEERKLGVWTQIVNIGATDAVIEEYGANVLFLTRNDALPSIPIYGSVKVVNDALPAGSSLDYPPIETVAFSEEQLTEAALDRAEIVCFGFVRYADEDKRVRTTAFYRVLRVPNGGAHTYLTAYRASEFARVNPANENYEYED